MGGTSWITPEDVTWGKAAGSGYMDAITAFLFTCLYSHFSSLCPQSAFKCMWISFVKKKTESVPKTGVTVVSPGGPSSCLAFQKGLSHSLAVLNCSMSDCAFKSDGWRALLLGSRREGEGASWKGSCALQMVSSSAWVSVFNRSEKSAYVC